MKVDKVARVDKVADIKVDMEVDLVVGKVTNMKVDKVADMKVDMVADMGLDKVADMGVDWWSARWSTGLSIWWPKWISQLFSGHFSVIFFVFPSYFFGEIF